MFKFMLASAATALLAAASSSAGYAAKMKDPFLACTKVEDLTEMGRYADSETMAYFYWVGTVIDGRCIILKKDEEVEVVRRIETPPVVLVRRKSDCAKREYYTGLTMVE